MLKIDKKKFTFRERSQNVPGTSRERSRCTRNPPLTSTILAVLRTRGPFIRTIVRRLFSNATSRVQKFFHAYKHCLKSVARTKLFRKDIDARTTPSHSRTSVPYARTKVAFARQQHCCTRSGTVVRGSVFSDSKICALRKSKSF